MPDPGPVVVAVDQGTSSTKAVALDRAGEVLGWASIPVAVRHPAPGRVEQDAEEIAASVIAALTEAVRDVADRVVAVGLSTQRESAVAWDTATGRALGPMLGWQDRRTAERAQQLGGEAGRVRRITGLPLDPMFSALKFEWLLDDIDPDRTRSSAGGITLGTLDAFLVRRLTGETRVEVGNASRTQLLDLATLDWSPELLALFRVPAAALPRVVASDVPTDPVIGVQALPPHVRIHAVLGDSHAALYGHGAREAGDVKATLGTGSSVMGLLPEALDLGGALATTVAWAAPEPRYAFEGNILATGATLVWLAELFGASPSAIAESGLDAPPSAIDLVPAFGGLGAPWWDASAGAVLSGFDLGTSRAALARAAVEAIPLQIEDVLAAAESATGIAIEQVLVDGGPAANDRLVQLIADLTGRAVSRPDLSGLSAVGAARLAGIAAGVWTEHDVTGGDHPTARFTPSLSDSDLTARRARWHRAVELARSGRTALEEETVP